MTLIRELVNVRLLIVRLSDKADNNIFYVNTGKTRHVSGTKTKYYIKIVIL